jgi:hypothetical protein
MFGSGCVGDVARTEDALLRLCTTTRNVMTSIQSLGHASGTRDARAVASRPFQPYVMTPSPRQETVRYRMLMLYEFNMLGSHHAIRSVHRSATAHEIVKSRAMTRRPWVGLRAGSEEPTAAKSMALVCGNYRSGCGARAGPAEVGVDPARKCGFGSRRRASSTSRSDRQFSALAANLAGRRNTAPYSPAGRPCSSIQRVDTISWTLAKKLASERPDLLL